MLFPVFASGGDDIVVLDPPKGLGPIKLFDAGACMIEDTRLFIVLVRSKHDHSTTIRLTIWLCDRNN